MSYDKAMKHSRNVRKVKRQARQYMGFDTGGQRWPSIRSTPEGNAYINIRLWFRERHRGDAAYNREAIREQIATLRTARAHNLNEKLNCER